MSLLRKDRPDILDDLPAEEDQANPDSSQPSNAGQPPAPADTGADKENGSSRNDPPEVDARTRANRENAQKSTGPRTPAGRSASSKNAVKDGLFSEDLTKHLSEEQLEHYYSFVDGVVKDLHPVGDAELHFAQRIGDIQFRQMMLRTAELKIYFSAVILSSTMEGCLVRSQNPMGLASLYDQRIQRSFSKTLEEFRQAQQLRLAQEKEAIEELKPIAAAHMQQNVPFDPAWLGFVISSELLIKKVRLSNAKKMAQFCTGDGIVEKKLVALVAALPKKAA